MSAVGNVEAVGLCPFLRNLCQAAPGTTTNWKERRAHQTTKGFETTLQDYLITTKIVPVQSKELFVLFSMFEKFVHIF